MDTFNLSYFATVTAFDLCSMYGFHNGPDSEELSCSRVWSKQDRLLMSNYLAAAKEKVERFLGYPLTPKFVCDERVSWNRGLIGPLKWGYLQKFGTKTEVDVATITPLDLTEDTVEVEATVTFTDLCEARFFLAADKGGGEVFPFNKEIASGTLTGYFHKCTLVDPTIPIPENGLDYEDDANFVDSLIVKRIYATPGTGATIIWEPNSYGCSSCTPCVETSQSACPWIRDRRLSLATVQAAAWDTDHWSGMAFANCGRYPDLVSVDYMAYNDEDCESCDEISPEFMSAIIHVALADMPRSVCGCNVHQATFQEDSQFADSALLAISTNFFGIKVGHIIAESTLKSLTIGQGGLLSHAAV